MGWGSQKFDKRARTDQDKPGQTRTDQDRPGQIRTDQDRSGQTKTDQERPGKTKTDQNTEDFNLADLILELGFLLEMMKFCVLPCNC